MMLSIVIAYLLIGNIVASEGALHTDDDYRKSRFPIRSVAATVVALGWPMFVTLAIVIGFMQAEKGK